MRTDYGKLNDAFYADWKARNGLAGDDAWKLDLKPGQVVVAANDIELFEGSRSRVRYGRVGVVDRATNNANQWAVWFRGKKYEWTATYKPNARYEDLEDGTFYWFDTEIVTLEEWNAVHGIEAPINNPEMYERQLIGDDADV
jgi:hypothetical protein